MTQEKEILKYMQTHKTPISSKVAFENFGCTRLGGVIYNLKRKGWKIETVMKNVVTRYGKKNVATYRLVEK